MTHDKEILMSREVTLLRGAIVGAITAVLHVLVVTGVVPTGTEQAVAGIVDAVGLVVALVMVRAGVTPVSDPRTGDGQQLR